MRGGYTFQRPSCLDYQQAYGDGSDSLWSSFDVVNLTYNHRQGAEKHFAELLNRIRTQSHTQDDLKILMTRVRHENDPEIVDCLRIYPTVNETISFNTKKMNDLPGKLFSMKAVNFTDTNENFKPRIDKSGRISDTQFLDELYLKIGARVMLIYNIGKYWRILFYF